VTLDELLAVVKVALGDADAALCSAGDRDRDGTISAAEVVSSVNASLTDCGD